ncbi:MAG: hypothetical protein IKP60_11350 [Treponema sp.]|nr:hypothetical protein [Treponema sp.]
MKIFEVIVCCAMFAVFSSLAVGIIVPTVKTASKTQELETELDRDRFLAEGFFKLCSEKKDEDLKSALVDWKKMCMDMWPLDFLEITKSGDFYFEKWNFNGKTLAVKYSIDESKNEN